MNYDIDAICKIIAAITPIITFIAYLTKPRWMKSHLAPEISRILSVLDPNTINEIISHLGSKEGRHNTAVDLLYDLIQRQPMPNNMVRVINREDCEQAVTAIEALYCHSIKIIKRYKK